MDLFDGVESCSVECVRPVGTTSLSDIPCLKTKIDSSRDAFADIQLQGDEAVWLVSATAAIAASVELEQGDTIEQEDGTTWEVVRSSLVTLDARFRALCRKVRENE
jgi:hypothetical protein